MDLAVIFKVGHAVLGVWIIAALVGRWVTLAKAGTSSDLAAVHTLLDASDRFEGWARQIPAVVLVLGIITAILQGRPFLGPLQGAGLDWLFVSIVLFVSIIPWIPLVFLPKARMFASALAEADGQGRVTPALTDAFRDRAVFAGHVYELTIFVLVFVLMITKPF